MASIQEADEIVKARLDNAITQAGALTDKAQTYARDAINASQSYFSTGSITPVKKPNVKIPDFYVNTDLAALFDGKYTDYLGKLQDDFGPLLDGFMLKFFPINAQLDSDLQAWLDDTITNGGVGLPLYVEDALFQRGRDREIQASLLNKDNAVHEFAARGYDLPSGALASRFQQADLDAQMKISELNRQVTIERYKERIETVKFAVAQAVDLRKHTYEYIRGLLGDYLRLGDIAAARAGALITAYKDLWSATAEYYRAVTTIEGMLIGVDTFNNEMNLKLQDLQFRSFSVSLTSRTNAAVSIADLFSRSAAAYVGAQNTIVQLASQDSFVHTV